jgi:aconitate hydratase
MPVARKNSFGARETLKVDGREYDIFALDALEKKGVGTVSRLPFSLKVLLENLLRQEDGRSVKTPEIEALASWKPGSAVRT